DVFEFSEYNRNDFIYSYITLTPEEIEQKKKNFAKMEAEKAVKKVEAAKLASEKKAGGDQQQTPKEN
ncbi:MAG: hypothetical protein Q7S39_08870, partial [Ignavibacteria bacterium]|nr:hypothetical protein [Ignavibacteria bacterium]